MNITRFVSEINAERPADIFEGDKLILVLTTDAEESAEESAKKVRRKCEESATPLLA